MPSYEVIARKTGVLSTVPVDAATREEAIAQVVATAAPGEEVEVLQAYELAAGPTGATGATGPTGVSGTSGTTGL
jgi:hypothetical protein